MSPHIWPCNLICKASVSPKSKHASSAPLGLHLPKIKAAKAMKPRPEVIIGEYEDAKNKLKLAQPHAAMPPDKITLHILTWNGEIPLTSRAFGFSPAILCHKPECVEEDQNPTITKSRITKIVGK